MLLKSWQGHKIKVIVESLPPNHKRNQMPSSDLPLFCLYVPSVILLHTVPDAVVSASFVADTTQGSHQVDIQLAELVSKLRAQASSIISSSPKIDLLLQVSVGDPGPTLCSFAEELGVEGVVCSSRGLGNLARVVLGSISLVERNRDWEWSGPCDPTLF